jgi:DNA-binding FadR family transcriptional regulator
MVDIMTHAIGQADALTFNRADAEFHALLLQAGGNRMLEHLSGIVASALQVSGGALSGCEQPTEVSIGLHQRIVDAMGSGEPAAAEAAMRQLLVPQDATAAAGSAPGGPDHVVPAPREH